MAYIGKDLVGVLKENRTVVTATGDGSTSLELNETPGSVNNVLVFLDGIRQQPTTDYTVSGSMLTFTTGPETDVKIVAIVGNHSGVEPKKGSVTTRKIVDGAVTGQKLADGNIPASKFTGAFSALDGANLTGVHSNTIHKSANDPAINTNTIDGQAVTLGQVWVNTTSGEMYICTDVTENAQHWMNVGAGEGDYTNVPPTNPTNATSGYTWAENNSHNISFTGGTDAEDGTPSHYVVDNILPADGKLTVNTNEVPAGSAHTFVAGSVDVDTTYTFRVRSKDSGGEYSTGVTITVTVTNVNYIVASGGTKVPVGDYYVHTFTGNSSFNVTAVPAGANGNIDYLVVAGGGSGGQGGDRGGGGGGAGGFLYLTGQSVSVQNYGVMVGAGGVGLEQRQDINGRVGSHSSFKGSTAFGGGGGRSESISGNIDGGSGGGGAGSSVITAGNSQAGQGNNGGQGVNTNPWPGGGGGGAGGAGAAGSGSNGGNGGAGILNNISGSNLPYAAGGGGASKNANMGSGGSAGGTIIGGYGRYGSTVGSGSSINGTINRGAGGGGDGSNPILGTGIGGSGVVIVRYRYQN